MWDQNQNYHLDTSASYKNENYLLELILNFQVSFEHLDEVAHILYKTLPLPV